MGDVINLELYRKQEFISFRTGEMLAALRYATGIKLDIFAVVDDPLIMVPQIDENSPCIIGWSGTAAADAEYSGDHYKRNKRAARSFNKARVGAIFKHPKDLVVAILDEIVDANIPF